VIPARYEPAVLLFFMTFLMGLVLSFIFQVQESGIGPASDFLAGWLGRFLRTYSIVVPLVLLVTPLARLLTRIVSDGRRQTVAPPATSAPD
jgi:hypothetical protein